MSHKGQKRAAQRKHRPTSQDHMWAELCTLHWTRTIFQPGCWQRALGMPSVMMTSRLQQSQLEAVPVGVPCSSGWRILEMATGIRATDQSLPELALPTFVRQRRLSLLSGGGDRHFLDRPVQGLLGGQDPVASPPISVFAFDKAKIALGQRPQSTALRVKRAVVPSPPVPCWRCSTAGSG